EPKAPEHACPCCGSRMRIVETFLPGQQPNASRSPQHSEALYVCTDPLMNTSRVSLCRERLRNSLATGKKWARLTRVHMEVGMGTATRLLLFVIATAVLVASPVARAAEEVDLLLVLSSDVSRSIDAQKFKSQRDGYAAAIVNPRVIQAIRSGALGKIAISFVEWSGVRQQEIVIDWTVIRDEATAKDFSA